MFLSLFNITHKQVVSSHSFHAIKVQASSCTFDQDFTFNIVFGMFHSCGKYCVQSLCFFFCSLKIFPFTSFFVFFFAPVKVWWYTELAYNSQLERPYVIGQRSRYVLRQAVLPVAVEETITLHEIRQFFSSILVDEEPIERSDFEILDFVFVISFELQTCVPWSSMQHNAKAGRRLQDVERICYCPGTYWAVIA